MEGQAATLSFSRSVGQGGKATEGRGVVSSLGTCFRAVAYGKEQYPGYTGI